MTKTTIELPESYAVVSRKVGVDVDVTKLSSDIIAKLALHGLTQKIGDSAASALADAGFKGMKFNELDASEQAAVQAKAKESMQAVMDSLVAGEWTERKAGESVDPMTNEIRLVIGEWLRSEAADVWKANFKPLDPSDRGEALDEFYEAQEIDIRDSIEAQAKARLDAKAKAKKGLKGIKIATKV